MTRQERKEQREQELKELKAKLYQLYTVENKSISEISKILCYTPGYIRILLSKFNIKRSKIIKNNREIDYSKFDGVLGERLVLIDEFVYKILTKEEFVQLFMEEQRKRKNIKANR